MSQPFLTKISRVKPRPGIRIGRLLFILFFTLPLIFMLIRSFSGVWQYPSLLPQSLSMRAADFIASQVRVIVMSILSSTAFSICAVLLSAIITLPAARVLSRRNFTGKSLLEVLLLAPLLVPSVVFAMGLYPLMISTGLADSFPGVVLVLTLVSFPYMLRALISGFDSYSPNLELTAAMYGAGLVRRLMDVHLPQLLPALLGGSIVVFLSAFSEYFLVFLVGGGVVPSFTGYLVPLIRASDWNIGSALSLLFIIIPVTLYVILDFLLSRYYRRRGSY